VTVSEALADVGFGLGKYILQLFMNYDCQKSPPHQCQLFRVWKIKMYCRSCEVFLKLPIHAGTMLHVLVRHRWVTYFGSLPHVQLTCQDTVTWYRWDCYLMNQVAERQICLR